MDYFKSDTICTKHRLWKNSKTVLLIVDEMISKGYQFKEMVYGEPNDFVFADTYENIEKQLKMRGSFFGIRIRFEREGILLSIESMSNGIDNVKYSVFADTEELMNEVTNDALQLKNIIKPSSNTLAQLNEYLTTHKQARTMIVVTMIVLLIVGINQVFPIISMALSIFMFAPLIFIYLIYVYTRRR
jgi:ABC-type multidrug transport system fused ATPase/permease subunit